MYFFHALMVPQVASPRLSQTKAQEAQQRHVEALEDHGKAWSSPCHAMPCHGAPLGALGSSTTVAHGAALPPPAGDSTRTMAWQNSITHSLDPAGYGHLCLMTNLVVADSTANGPPFCHVMPLRHPAIRQGSRSAEASWQA